MINIDATNCDIISVEKELLKLVRSVVMTIRSELGYEQSVALFCKVKLTDYVLRSVALLKNLGLDVVILNTLLSS